MSFSPDLLADGADSWSGPADIRADRLEVEHEKRIARFRGNVKAVYGDLTISCGLMIVRYDTEGEIVSLVASERVVVARDEIKAKASSARLRPKESLLILEGNPVLFKGPNRLEGSRIMVHLNSQKMEIEEARGTFLLGNKKEP